MRRTEVLKEIRKMRFERVYTGWRKKELTQEEAARILGVSDRTFRRYIPRYKEDGLEGLLDKRLSQASHRRAPVDEVMAVCDLYKERYSDFNVKHFYKWYVRDYEGQRSYTWVKNTLQERGLVKKRKRDGSHRKRRDRVPYSGMMLHQDGSTHEWVPGKKWDLIVTMDDATNEHYSMFFVNEEGTFSSFRGIRDVIEAKGVFSSLYTDRGSHYWYTPEAGGKVDKTNPTQFGKAMRHLGIEMIAAYSPQARGRSERAFRTHQDRLVKELAFAGIKNMAEANRYLRDTYLPSFNEEFSTPPAGNKSVFVPWIGGDLDDIFCEQYERVVTNDNCISFNATTFQIPEDDYRYHYVKVKVRVLVHMNNDVSIFHGPRLLARYDEVGNMIDSSATFKNAA